MKNGTKRFTVFTPTYNRGYTIDRLYRSLQKQSFCDFEWVIVDDGSTDDTEKRITEYLNDQNPFMIRYTKVNNGGKHRAINRGLELARGELFFIVDSDDSLTDRALEIIDQMEKTIPQSEKCSFAGVCGQKGYTSQEEVGHSFYGETLDITMLERKKYGISGDKAEVFYTEVLRKYPFPEYEGEKFMTECVVWDRIAYDGLKLRFFNEIVYLCEYLPDGLSAHENQLFKENPKGYGLYLHQSDRFGKVQGIEKWNQYFRYYNQFRHELKFSEIAGNLHMDPLVFYFRIFGMKVFYKLYDR